MSDLTLLNSTGSERVDRLLREVISRFESAFPGRIRGCFVEGSYADASAVASSDVDITIVFKGGFRDKEQHKAEQVGSDCKQVAQIELDIDIVDEERLAGGAWPSLKLASLCVYGDDIREAFALIPLAQWTRDRMHTSYWRVAKLFQRPEVITYPLEYPDPDGEFYGYDTRKVRLPNGEEVSSTRNLIRLTGWAATAMIAFKARRYVARKSDCYKLYQACFQDEWSQLLEDIFEYCKKRWNYLIPEDAEDRKRLRDICRRTLKFENHFLTVYKEYLLRELRDGSEQGKQQALWVLEQVPFQNEDVFVAMSKLSKQNC